MGADGLTRRQLLRLLGIPPIAVAAACSTNDSGSSDAGGSRNDSSSDPGRQTLEPTPACGEDPTPPQTEGPFFSAGTPERSSLREPGVPGTLLVVEGAVVTTACAPIERVRIEFWQTDDGGEYDNDGYRLRGHLFTDTSGAFRLETIVPGLYEGRTRHIHATVAPPNADTLTTQLYFPEEPRNSEDGIFDERLLMAMGENADGGRLGSFTFVLDA